MSVSTTATSSRMRLAIEALGYLGEPATSAAVPNKKPKLSTPTSVPSPAAASPAATPGTSKSVSKPPPAPKSKVPIEPLAKLKYLLQECLDTDDDDEEASEIASKAWGIIADVTSEQSDMIAIAVSTILKIADDETLVYMGKILQFTMRLRKWVVAEHNKDKKSPMIPKMLKLLSQIRLPLEMYEKQQWDKVLNAIHRKSELDKSREFANQIMTRFQHLEKERARKEREAKKLRGANTDKQKAVTSGVVKKEPSSSLNTGVKRTIEEVGKGTTANASKKVSLGEVRNSVSNSNIPKSAGPSVPAKNGISSTSSSSAGDKKPIPSSAGASTGPTPSSTTATATAKSKPPASSGFFKTLGKSAEPAKAQSKAPEKKSSTQQTPSAPTTSFTSIFAQLQQRQKEQDREKKDAANKAADTARTSDEDKKKKKKTVKWKTGDDLVKVQVFEWQEPEGEYYGGGSGMAEHGWGDATGEGEALKNRNFIEEEEDLMEWYQPKRG
ncbi:hypothetical protein K440DRAFT_253618 [Wilcoxina mikolae CBS 423.85]|nr:hypothetical protein K440DRAFT_253618 [Wilcoxina mikolae CBS 423.85]